MSSPWISTCRSSTYKRRDSSCEWATSSPDRSIQGHFDLVTARAVLHHVTEHDAAIRNLVAGLARGRDTLIEPDFLPVSVAEPPERASVLGRVARVVARPRDRLPPHRSDPGPTAGGAGLEQVAGTAEAAVPKGTRPGRTSWIETITELRDQLVGSEQVDDRLIDAFLVQCADPGWWTETIAFTAVHARAPVSTRFARIDRTAIERRMRPRLLRGRGWLSLQPQG